jgi:dUTP pyrophosphatase
MKHIITPAFIGPADGEGDLVEILANDGTPSWHVPILRYTKVRAGAVDPVRANRGDAGIDFFVPKHTWEKNSETGVGMIQLEPGARVLIPTGIKLEVPAGYALIFFNKSGITTKYGLIVGAAVVDHNYQGEVHLSIINTNNENPVYLEEGDKLAQGVLLPVGLHHLVETPLEEMYADDRMIESNRGEGGFGSTGVKVEIEPIKDTRDRSAMDNLEDD